MLQFFKYVFATLIGLFLFCFLSIIFLVILFTAAAPENKETLSDNSVLKIVLDKNIEERESDNFFGQFGGPLNAVEPSIGLLELRQVLENAKSDGKIKGIYLDASGVSGGFATLQELRKALVDFKKSGKFIVAYSDYYSERAYYLASVADKIYLPPSGLLEFNGLESELLFFKGTLEKLELKPEIFRVGSFKSAIEPLVLDKMSDSSRVQTSSFITSIYNSYLEEISSSRNLDMAVVKNISDSMLVRNAEDAFKLHLITDLQYYDEAENFIRKKTGTPADEKIKFISNSTYYSKHHSIEKESGKGDQQVAVIFASGEIFSGKGDENRIGSESLCNEIRKAKLDKDIKAIVLRINSPGGSALASDIIWREITLAKKVKPVIASMSDVAASGGYYLAMACDTVLAQPTTITGSIGVFGVVINAENFLKNKLGITTDRVKTGTFSDLGSPTRSVTPMERKVIQQEVDQIYEDFTSKAANGRGMTQDALKSVASGRVWSGTEAVKNHLVDGFGGLQDAIKIAAAKSKLGEDYHVVYLPEQKNFYLKELFSQWGDADEDALIRTQLGKFYPYFSQIKNLQKMEGIQARIPFEIIIK